MENYLQKRTVFYPAKFALLIFAMMLSTFWSTARHAPPVPPTMAYFTESPQKGCAPLLVHFFNASGPGSYYWDFGDPTSGLQDTSTACGPFHVFNTPGSYTVKLTVNGTSTHTEIITVLPSPTPHITGPINTCQGPNYSYIYSVPLVAGSTYTWNVNGGAYSTNVAGNIATVIWSTPGVNIISCTETNSVGCKGTDQIKVTVAPLPDLSAYLPCGQKASGNPPGTIVNPQEPPREGPCVCANSIQTYFAPNDGNFYKWVVSNGTIVSIGPNGSNVQVKWGNSGIACITLIDSNVFGCKDSAKCCFQLCPGPKARFVITSSPACVGSNINFTATSIAGGGTYSWDFGDGNNGSGQITDHIYTAAGNYNVKLTVTNSTGCTSDTTLAVTITPGNAPHIFCPGSVCANSQAVYWTLRIPGAVYNWTVTGGTGVPNLIGDTIRVTWGPGPIGKITLSVSSTTFYTCPQPITVSVPILPAVPAITGSILVCVGTSYTYTAPLIPGSDYVWTVTGASLVQPNGNSVTIIWDGTATGTITLHMKNDLICCKGANSIVVTKKPVMFISGNPTVCQNSTWTYTAPVACNWIVVGGTPTSASATSSITVTWGPAGTGIITASPIVAGAYCNNPASLSVNIVGPPLPAQISGPNMVCVGSVAAYTVNVATGLSSTWSVTGGFLSPPTTPTATNVTWTVTGAQTIKVTQTNSTGCSTVSTYTVYVVPAGVPAISGSTTACVHDTRTYSFVLPAGIPIAAYQWSVIGGNVVPGPPSNILQVEWGFSGGGTVTLTNVICNASTTLNVAVYDTPTIVINQSGINCAGTSVILTAVSDALCTYQWTGFPAGQTITVTTPGTYTVKVTNPAGCFNIKSILISPIPSLPHPACGITKTQMYSPDIPSLYPFLFQFCVPDVPGNTYSWSSGETTPCIWVRDNVIRTVTVTGANGCTCTNADSVPHGTTTGGGTGTGGSPGCVISPNCPITTLTAGSGSGWSWTFNGSPYASTQAVSVSPGPGTYAVTYTDGLGNPQSCYYTYYGPTPVANFAVISTCNPVTFNNTTTPLANYYVWNYGDGSFSNGFPGSHVYQTAGIYTVKLSVSNDLSCWTSKTVTINVKTVVKAKFSATIGCTPSITFNNLTTISGISTPASYSYNFGDASSGPGPSHTYLSGGTYTVVLTAVVNGCVSTYTQTIDVPQLVSLISTCGISCANQSMQMRDLSIHTSPIVGWLWVFDGGASSSTLQAPWKTFTPGPHTVQLTVTDSRGCSSTSILFSFTASVFAPGSITVVGPTVFCEGGSVLLKAPAGYSYIWSTGATTGNIVVTTSGTYSVVVVNANGCTANLGPITVIVHPNPVATITLSGPNPFCDGHLFTLFAPQAPGYTYAWLKNGVPYGGSTSSISLFSATDAGTYVVTVTNSFGCSSTSTPVVINVIPSPAVNITSPVSWLCHGTSAVLTANNIGSVPIVSYLWSTGDITPSITVNKSGIYSVTVIGNDGCPFTASFNMQAVQTPDFSNIPKGCYVICMGQRDTVRGPSGSYSYAWYNGPSVVGTAQNYVVTGPGTYYLVVHDLVFGCYDTSATFTVTVTAAPVAHITPSGPLVLCTGTGGSLTLTATYGSGYTYLWTRGTTIVGTTQSVTVTSVGTYVLTVHVNNCCYAKDSVTIREINCCFNVIDSAFITIPDQDSIFTDQVWKGKYFIAGKVHVFGTATLDLSVIDLVFDKTGEIIFHDQSFLRANNSVFRPCQIDGTWQGLTFLDNSAGYIHTSTFKNAEDAIQVTTDGTSVKIVDNTFSQCHNGVYIDLGGNSYSEGITGNSFVIDDNPLPFTSNDYFGISLNNVSMREMIAQNNFRNANLSSAPKNYYGIFAMHSSAVASSNTFTNMHRSFDVQAPVNYFSIENNNIEITQSVTVNDYQIRVSNGIVPVVIFGNNITNSMQFTPNTAAIYVANEHLANVKGNHIIGFDLGIQMQDVLYSQVLENSIENSKSFGVYNAHGPTGISDHVDIACNTIKMDLTNGNIGTLPIGVFTMNSNQTTEIRTNCIFNCDNAIYVYTAAFGTPIPVIKNNFMYNYVYAGINNANHSGSIGTNGGAFGTSGRNTFVKNMASAFDILSSPGITAGGNFGQSNVSGVSIIGPADRYNSTADCGVQINYTNLHPVDIVIDSIAICDHYPANLYPLINVAGTGAAGSGAAGVGKFVLADNASDGLAALKNDQNAFVKINAALLILSQKADMTSATTFYNEVISSGVLQGNDAQWFDYSYACVNGNFSKATSILNAIKPMNDDESDLQNIEQIRLHLISTKAAIKSLSTGEQGILTAIDNRRGLNAAIARDMLQMSVTKHDYIFKKMITPKVDPSAPKPLDLNSEFMQVYPNPVHEVLNIRYNIQSTENHSLKVVDVTGKEIRNTPLTYTATEMQLDVANLVPGVYVIYITNSDNLQRVRFVKE